MSYGGTIYRLTKREIGRYKPLVFRVEDE
jgi:hypothetical protein